MLVVRLVLGPLETNCWVIADDEGGPALVIDPAEDADRILSAIQGRRVAAVVLTHRHFDHIGAVRELLGRSGAPLMVHEADADALSDSEGTGGAQFGFDQTAPSPDRRLCDGDVVDAGRLHFTVLHTPGHTPGGICLYVVDPDTGVPHLFSGDTLFAGSVGRSDFAGGDAHALMQSIAGKLAPLPAETIVHPGHGPDTTIGRERTINPFWPRA
jgi:hydroxyacylglutathione hydrolase